MKLASLVHPSKKWPARTGHFGQAPTDWQVIVFSATEGWLYYYAGVSKFRALLAVARVCEFADGNDGHGVFLGEDHIDTPETRAAWDAANRKRQTRWEWGTCERRLPNRRR